jgi:hypothetical protein
MGRPRLVTAKETAPHLKLSNEFYTGFRYNYWI